MPRTKIQASDGISIEIWSATNAHIASIFNSAGTLKIDGNNQIDFTFSGAIKASILSGGSFKTFDALATSSTTGFFYLGSVAGTPSGVATTYSGLVPLVYDSTNDRLYVYNSSWKVVGGGITTLNTLTAATQTFSPVNDTNVTITIGISGTTIHTFTMGWASTLSIARGGTNAGSFAATNGLAYFDGTSLVNSSNFTTNGTDAGLGGAINSLYRLYVLQSGAQTTTKYAASFWNTSTSSTASISKIGASFVLSGNWSGSSADSTAIGAYANVSSCPTVIGIDIEASGATTNTYGVYSEVFSSSGTNYGIYITSSGGSTNYAIYVASGLSVFTTEVRTNASLTTSSTTGFFYLGAVAGTPTAAPPTTYSGTVPMVYDSTNNKLYVYNGAWKSVTLA
jgi:hypothetical protein